MAITFDTQTRGLQVVREGTWQSSQVLTQSTATAAQQVSLSSHVTVLGGGTATGITVNRYTLGTASGVPEGLIKFLMMNSTATGEAKLATTDFTTSTGSLTFATAGAWAKVQKIRGTWWILNSSGTAAATQ